MKNLNMILLAVIVSMSMYNCMEVGLGAGDELEAEGRLWPWTNCQTQTEMDPDCCL